jgi:hypothetical protein
MPFANHFTITKKDNLRFNFFLMKKKLIATSITVFVIISAMVGLIRYAQGAPLGVAVLRALLLGLGGTALLIAVNAVSTVMRLNNLYRQKKLLDFSVDFTVDAAGIHARSERGDSDLPWSRITSVQETRHAFYIFITDTHANVMPKDQLKSGADVAALRGLFQKHLDAPRRRLKSAA